MPNNFFQTCFQRRKPITPVVVVGTNTNWVIIRILLFFGNKIWFYADRRAPFWPPRGSRFGPSRAPERTVHFKTFVVPKPTDEFVVFTPNSTLTILRLFHGVTRSTLSASVLAISVRVHNISIGFRAEDDRRKLRTTIVRRIIVISFYLFIFFGSPAAPLTAQQTP